MENKIKEIYNIGKRDALVQIFMMIRNNNLDFKKVFKELIAEFKKSDSENPHCEWLEKNLK